jgi:U3 small nucleolar RNA-associated protein 10
MALSVFVSKGSLEDVAVTAFMEQTVYGWTNNTIRPGLVTLAIMAQHRSAKQMSSKVTKALLKVSDIGALLVEIGQDRRVDKLANGLCLALIERLTKKADPRGLPTILAILNSRILKDRQIAVVFKSLLLTALKLDDGNDQDGTLRRELGSTLITLSQISGASGAIIQTVIQEVDFDIEELEIKLDVSFRTRKLPEAAQGGLDMEKIDKGRKAPKDLGSSIEDLSTREESVSPCLLPQPKEIFEEFSELFISIVSERSQNPGLIKKFEESPKLGHKTAMNDCTFFGFFIRIWCGPYPALARAAALDAVKRRMKAKDATATDAQALLPYCFTAMADPSKRVRQSAAQLVTVLASPEVLATPKNAPIWGAHSLYGSASTLTSLNVEAKARLLQLQILPSIEECIMDPAHVSAIIASLLDTGKYAVTPDPSLDEKDHMSQANRTAILSFLGSHTVSTPLLLVKDRLLVCLNEVRGVSSMTRTKVLLPALRWWCSLTDDEVLEQCSAEHLDAASLDSRFVNIVVANDVDGLEYLLEILKSPSKWQRDNLIQAIFSRFRNVWTALKDDVRYTLAEQLLEISQGSSSGTESDTFVAGEAADLLRTVPLNTEILMFFLDSIKTGTKMITEPPPNKRRRTSSTAEGGRSLASQVTPELSRALRKITFVLQLVENSDPVTHPELLSGLFTALSELQHFRTVVGSELGYLQNLILRSLLAMMPAYKANRNLKIPTSGGYGDLLVNCIQKSSSPVVQNAALLLIASLATTAPSLVLHSVMPIFTFMGTSVLRQSDDYSAHVVYQTIKEVVPPLIASLRQGKKNPIAGASEILVSFTTAYEHIPSHRRKNLFSALVETLGPAEFLYALIGMLVDRYGPSDALLHFILDLLNGFTVEVQLETLVKLLDLTSDLLKPKPEISLALLGTVEDGDQKDVEQLALRQLSAYPTLLSSKSLRSQVRQLVELDDMEASEVRSLYATLLENILVLADKVKANKSLHARCGAALSNLLNLLSTGEFIKAVESLLDRPDMGLRQKVLRALEVRVEKESNTDASSRTVLLAFLPQLTAAIRESSDVRYKYTAVTCVDKIAEKYGKKDIEAVVAAASTIAGEHCLGQDEKQLRVMSLLCLTSLVDVLQDAVVPVLPIALPRAVDYLHQSVQLDEPDQDLHSACYGLLSSLAEHLPYMLTTYVGRVLEISYMSAEAGLGAETNESRISCLQFFAEQLDIKDTLTSLDATWDKARSSGFSVRISIK